MKRTLFSPEHKTFRDTVRAFVEAELWTVNRKRVERSWRKEGLKVPQAQPKREVTRGGFTVGAPTPHFCGRLHVSALLYTCTMNLGTTRADQCGHR